MFSTSLRSLSEGIGSSAFVSKSAKLFVAGVTLRYGVMPLDLTLTNYQLAPRDVPGLLRRDEVVGKSEEGHRVLDVEKGYGPREGADCDRVWGRSRSEDGYVGLGDGGREVGEPVDKLLLLQVPQLRVAASEASRKMDC